VNNTGGGERFGLTDLAMNENLQHERAAPLQVLWFLAKAEFTSTLTFLAYTLSLSLSPS